MQPRLTGAHFGAAPFPCQAASTPWEISFLTAPSIARLLVVNHKATAYDVKRSKTVIILNCF